MSLGDEVGKAKAWFLSKTIIAALIGTLGIVIQAVWGVNLGDVIALVWEGAETAAEAGDNIWFLAQEAFAFLVAIWARFKATVKIKPLVE